MNCQDVQQLLAFADRKAEELDQAERDAFKQHLEKCPDCAETVQAERGADLALGTAMRDVPVPVGLKEKVIKRLSAERGGVSWKWGTAAAAAVLLIVSGTVWYLQPLPNVTLNDVQEFPLHGAGWDEGKVEKFFADRRLKVVLPSDIDIQYLRHIEVVEFKKQRIAKLTYQLELGIDQRIQADVLILPHRQFRTDQLPPDRIHGLTKFEILRKENYTYLIFYRGELEFDKLRRPIH